MRSRRLYVVLVCSLATPRGIWWLRRSWGDLAPTKSPQDRPRHQSPPNPPPKGLIHRDPGTRSLPRSHRATLTSSWRGAVDPTPPQLSVQIFPKGIPNTSQIPPNPESPIPKYPQILQPPNPQSPNLPQILPNLPNPINTTQTS